MFSRNLTRQSRMLTFRRGVANPGFKKPEFEKTLLTSHERPSPHAASSIKNGVMGTKLFPRGTVWPAVKTALPRLVQGTLAGLTIIVLWPVAVVGVAKFWGNVPAASETAQVQWKGFSQKPEVDIPQTYAQLSKTDDE